MHKILIWLSGAHPDVLAMAPSERPKYEGIGGVVLTTAVMAALSCGFALTFALDAPLYVAIVLGVLWGFAIMNLDRWLISATPRRDTWWKNLLQTTPRLIVALLIGTVVSTPLVMQVFRPEIDQQLEVIQQRDQEQFNKKAAADQREVNRLGQRVDYYKKASVATQDSPVVLDHPSVKNSASQLNAARKARTTALQQFTENPTAANQRLLDEASATVQGRTEQYNTVRSKVTDDLNDEGQQNLPQAEQTYRTALQRYEQSSDQFNETNEERTGLLARLEALRELTTNNGTLQRAYLLLLLFITMIEVLPVLVKFLMTLGDVNAYERALVMYEGAKRTEADLRMKDHEAEVTSMFRSKEKDRDEMTKIRDEIKAAEREAMREEELNKGTRRRRSGSTYTRS